LKDQSTLATFYAVAARTKVRRFQILLGMLLEATPEIDEDDPSLQHSIDTCIDSLKKFGCL
jgi:hypothetical protein